jgi:HEAT repeat protein
VSHEAPEVRAEAARVFPLVDTPLDSASAAAIAGMLAVEDTPFVLAAVLDTLGTVGNGDAEAIVPFLKHDDADVRQAAIVALGRLGWPETEYRLRVLLASDDSEERAIGARAVGELRSIRLLDALEPALYDVQARPAALEAMAALGPGAVPMMMDLLDRRELPLPLRRSVVSTLATVGGLDARNALVSLVDEPALGPAALTSLDRMRSAGLIEAIDPKKMHASLEAEMRKGLRYAAAATAIRDASAEPRELFAAGELRGLQQRSVERVLKILGLSYDTNRLNAISDGIRSESAAQRSNALELLEGTMSRTTGTTVMPFLEAVAEGLPRARLDELLDDPDRIRAQPAESLLNDDDWWPRAIGLHLLGRDDEVTTPGQSPDERSKDGQMIPLIEKVMILKGSEFFKNFPGADLAGIASLADVVQIEPAEVVFEQGDEGDAFYVVVRGAIKISRGQTLLATLGPREGFGEMAILDRDTRSATATASEGTTLLRLDRDSFDRVVEQNPVVARGIYRVLTERLRNTLAQVAAG